MHATLRAAAVALALTIAAVSCERGAPARGSAGAPADTLSGRTFRTRLVFVGGSPDSLVAAVVRTSAASAGAAEMRHRAFGWVGRTLGWQPFLAAEWRGAPMRNPALLLPHDGMRLMVGADGSLESVAFDSAAPPFRIDVGDTLLTDVGAGAAVMTLRRATLRMEGEAIPGALLVSADVVEGDARPAARVAAVLADGRGRFILVVQGSDADRAWVAGVGADSGHAIPLTVVPLPGDAPDAPRFAAWSLRTPGAPDDASAPRSAAEGELRTLGGAWVGTGVQAGFERFDGVRGWLRLDGRRISVAGVVQRGGA